MGIKPPTYQELLSELGLLRYQLHDAESEIKRLRGRQTGTCEHCYEPIYKYDHDVVHDRLLVFCDKHCRDMHFGYDYD